jgi:hypothetical protein
VTARGPFAIVDAELILQQMARQQQSRAVDDPMAPLMGRLERMAERWAHVNGPQPPASQCSPAELMVRKALRFGDVGSPEFRLVVRAELHEFVEAMRAELSA